MNWAPLIAGSTLVGGLPPQAETNYWVDENGSIVCTDEGRQTIIDDIIFYWCDDSGSLVVDDTGTTTSLLHVT